MLGHHYSQAPFGYQAKCLATLRAAFAMLDDASGAQVERALPPAAITILADG